MYPLLRVPWGVKKRNRHPARSPDYTTTHTLSNDPPFIEGYWKEYELNAAKLPLAIQQSAIAFPNEQRRRNLKQGRFCAGANIDPNRYQRGGRG
jgi:hypothetical protein